MPVNFQIIQTPEWILYNCPNCGEEEVQDDTKI
jgi:predicted RNA-binding Zn-ribbon protein involved in translation (DUF1610 family)